MGLGSGFGISVRAYGSGGGGFVPGICRSPKQDKV